MLAVMPRDQKPDRPYRRCSDLPMPVNRSKMEGRANNSRKRKEANQG
jgi:hypothetical protein